MFDDPTDPDERCAADLLLGAAKIAVFLNELGLVEVKPGDVYYLHKAKRLPITKFGKRLIASRARIRRHANKLTAV
jgi:hypothetical protein